MGLPEWHMRRDSCREKHGSELTSNPPPLNVDEMDCFRESRRVSKEQRNVVHEEKHTQEYLIKICSMFHTLGDAPWRDM